MKHSIQNRLFLLASIVFLATWIGASQISNTQGFRNAQAILEREVARGAELVLKSGLDDAPAESSSEEAQNHSLAIWKNGAALSETGLNLAQSTGENRDFVQIKDRETWVFAERCDGGRCVVYGAAHTRRHQNLYCLAASIFGPIFLILFAGFIGMLGSIHYAMRPIKTLTDKVTRIDLQRPVALQINKPAAEFVPLISAIDALGAQVRKLLDRERMFLGSCAHEIRTPLSGLIGQLQVSEQSGLENIRACAERTVRVANQFLTFASSKSLHASGQNIEQFELCETLRAAISPLLSDTEGVDVEMNGVACMQVEAHPFAISTIASNLVQNAIKYARTENGLRLNLSVLRRDDHAVIIVADDGPGMTNRELKQACQEFSRFDRSQTKTGAGLGLSIVNEIVSQYGGTLTLSRCENLGGLEVEVALPICATPKLSTLGHRQSRALSVQSA